jgi:hypothetical protein
VGVFKGGQGSNRSAQREAHGSGEFQVIHVERVDPSPRKIEQHLVEGRETVRIYREPGPEEVSYGGPSSSDGDFIDIAER